jgi:hypothetical protein
MRAWHKRFEGSKDLRAVGISGYREPIVVVPVFTAMKVREENCNLLLLTAVMLFSCVVALAADWWAGPQNDSIKPPIYLARQASAVRVVGAPFVPNVNPRARQ